MIFEDADDAEDDDDNNEDDDVDNYDDNVEDGDEDGYLDWDHMCSLPTAFHHDDDEF